MSMWEIEALVEESINFVDKTEGTNEHKVQLIGNLYAIQNQYDCKFTNFRVMPILLKTGYTRAIDYTEHPDYEGNEAWFEKQLKKKDDIVFINRDIKKRWSEKNDVVAYLENETRKIYIDYGSPLRKDEGALELMSEYDLGLHLIREAHKLRDKALVYDWTAYLIKLGSNWFKETMTADELISRYFSEIKTIWYAYDYTDYKPINESLTIYPVGAEDSDRYTEYAIEVGGEEGEFIQWFLDKERV
ncbi:hypothetical protein L3C95_18600 [Chitinophaga filiformis]|uniref:hypothetical protein n=1 Tax=Chitinophaga filiformis TaxID=104663 RepID=UPI001F1DDCD8|nr:hypothetical protein [Chitinophaga filiformis]MCF6404917.1 hypothetical protein [Chitinophaga filiformis]